MEIKSVLKKYKFSPEAIDTITGSGITEFYPPQASGIKQGILDRKNLLLSVPTAAGKTLMAELCMLRSILQDNGRCLYIAPLKALASEKYHDFKEKYAKLGIKVGIAIGDLDTPPNKTLNRYQILIATAEKVDSLLRSKAQWLIQALSVVVLDEIHFINDGSRGPTMEILTARIKQLNSNVQILALSATVSNAESMAGWLDAQLVQSDWRPIPLKEGVYFNEAVQFDEYGSRMILEDVPDDLSKLTLDTLRGKGQVLVFVNSRRSAQAVSRQISKAVSLILKPEEKEKLIKLAKDIIGPEASSTKVCRKLAEVITHGVAFHHAGLKPHQRKLIEDNFRGNLIKAISSTPTLAAGVNLPARRVIIRDFKRYESGLGACFIPTSEYKQCAGRAGRPQYDEYGEAVLVAKSFSESQALFDKYILASPEPVTSKLANEAALRMHILSSIAAGYIHDINGMFDFISHTFLAYQKQTPNLIELITEIFDFLQREEFIEKSGFRFFATAFGQCTSRLYIDPISSLTMRDGLKKVHDGKSSLSPIGLLHLMCCCPDSPVLNVGKNDYEDLDLFEADFRKDFIYDENNEELFDDIRYYFSTLKTTSMLYSWIEEEKEDVICDQFGIGPGDIYRHVESIQWLLYGAGVIADLFQFKRQAFFLEDLRKRVRYGIKEDLLDLAKLKGVGRVRARILYQKGIKDLSDLKYMSTDELSKVSKIGKTLAKDILTQVTRRKGRHSTQLPAG